MLADNGLTQINFRIRNNDNGLASFADGGASNLGQVNEHVPFECAGEGYTGGICRIHFTVRQFGPFTRIFRIYKNVDMGSWTNLQTFGLYAHVGFDPLADYFDHNDDCPWIWSPLGGPPPNNSYVEDNNCAIRSAFETGSCTFLGLGDGGTSNEETEIEVSLWFDPDDLSGGEVMRFIVRLSPNTAFSNGYDQAPQITIRKQLIGADWISAGFRGRLDDGPENLAADAGGASWIADKNTGWIENAGGEGFAGDLRIFRPRHLIQGALPFDDEVQFVQRYAHKPAGGSYGPDLEITSLSSVIQTASSDYLTDGADTTELSDRIGSGAWLANGAGVIESGLGSFHNWTTAAEEVELEFCNQVVPEDLDEGDKIRLRVYRVVPPTAVSFNAETSYPLETYAEELEITIVGERPPALDQGIATLLDMRGLGTYPGFGGVLPTTGTIILTGEEQESDDQGMIAVIPDGGEAERELGEFPRYQIISSDLSYDVALARAEAVHQVLHGHQGALLGWPVGRIRAEFEPILLGRGLDGVEGGRVRFTQTFTVITRKFKPFP